MDKPASFRLLAATNNARGDLFTRLKKDLFFALGYDDLQFDVHRPGRELDILGTHRHLERRLVVECKAHVKKMGGDAINKFRGAVAAERKECRPVAVDPYFVSLGGFTNDAIKQEEGMGDEAIALLDGQKVIAELQKCRAIATYAEAVDRAGRCAAHARVTDAALDGAELLGDESGYLWAVFYSHGKLRTHFALIHADGTALAQGAAATVIEADRACSGSLHALRYLAPPLPGPDRETLVRESARRYRQWVVAECGEIELQGLPADTDLATKRMKIERLFVPLKLVTQLWLLINQETGAMKQESEINSVGEYLAAHPRFSLLAKPGGGKSTLLKRLAVAYAMPERRTESDDHLPERDWLPLFLRCRDLRDRAHRPTRALLDELPLNAGMNGDEALIFREHMDEALRSGRALLLIDGLDEISDEGARTTFAGHLRTFLAMFPQVAMVVTSREAGYRHVAGVIASACDQVTLAPFDQADVERLCESWHVEVVGDNEKVRSEAKVLATTIWSNERIRALAENPLMLTTLLVVRRCSGGELPTRRVELYREAVRVLIRTWNIEGFEPMDLDETLAQLSYVACAMLNEGVQRIGQRRLLKLLQDARSELQAELQFARISAEKFVERIEYRSSLLMQTGHERIDGELQPVYEFRHLTFQEYLAARGLVEEQYPGRNGGQNLVELLEPHFEDERWREVIPLATVLAGRKAEEPIKRLTAFCEAFRHENTYPDEDDAGEPRVVLLRQCLFDEVQATPSTLRAALREMARFGDDSSVHGSVLNLLRGKFGEVLVEVTEEAYFGNYAGWEEFGAAMTTLAVEAFFKNRLNELTADAADSLARSLSWGEYLDKVRAAFVCMRLAYSSRVNDTASKRFQPLRDAVGRLLSPDFPQLALPASWALVWIGHRRLFETPPDPMIIRSLFRLWRETESRELRRLATWALANQPLLSRDTFSSEVWGDCDEWLERQATGDGLAASLVIAWYRRKPWSDFQLVEKLRSQPPYVEWQPSERELRTALGVDIVVVPNKRKVTRKSGR